MVTGFEGLKMKGNLNEMIDVSLFIIYHPLATIADQFCDC